MKVTKTVFEGTPEEYKAFVAAQEGAAVEQAEPGDSDRAGSKKLPTWGGFIRDVLQRMEIPDGQKVLYRVLYGAGEAGRPRRQLFAAMNRTDDQLSGVLGALGRRVKATPGYAEIALETGHSGIGILFSLTKVDGHWCYHMRPELRRVLEQENYDWLKP